MKQRETWSLVEKKENHLIFGGRGEEGWGEDLF
jgi:hypothetical protein